MRWFVCRAIEYPRAAWHIGVEWNRNPKYVGGLAARSTEPEFLRARWLTLALPDIRIVRWRFKLRIETFTAHS